MQIKVYVRFERDVEYTDITKYIQYNSIKFNIKLLNSNFKSVQDNVKLKTVYNESLNDKFFQATSWLPAYIEIDNKRAFTGAVYPSVKDAYKSNPDEGVSFEIVDNGYLLDVDCSTFAYRGQYRVFDPADTAHSLVHRLLYDAGLTSNEISSTNSILSEIAYIAYEAKEATYKEILSKLLYEFHNVYYFNAEGQFCLYDWKHEQIPIQSTIKNSVIKDRAGIRRKRNLYEFDGYKIAFRNLLEKENALIYREDINEEGRLLLSAQSFPTDAEIRTVKQTYSSRWLTEEATILMTENQHLVLTADDGITKEVEVFENLEAQIALKNNTLSDKRIYQFDIRADVLYTDKANEFTIPGDSQLTEDAIELDFIFNEQEALNFANAIYNNGIRHGLHTYEFSSEESYDIAKCYTLEQYGVNVLLVGKKYNPYDKIFEYECLSVGAQIMEFPSIVYKKPSANSQNTTAVFYDLVVNTVVVKKELGGIFVPGNITLESFKTSGNGLPAIYTGVFKISVSVDGTNFTPVYTTDPTTYYSYSIPPGTKAIKTELYSASTNTLLDTKTIVVVEDGATGSAGQQGPKGDTGIAGLSSVETLVFKRYASTPASPTGGSYNFGTKVLTPPSGWSVSIPTGTDPVWASIAFASIQGITGTANITGWSTPAKVFQDGAKGADGKDGVKGADGQSVNMVFKRSSSQPATPANSAGVPATWYDSINNVPVGSNPMWSSVGTKATATSNWVWQIPIKVEGIDGEMGIGISSVVEYYLASSSSAGVTTSTAGWTTTMQSMTTTKKYLWNYEKIIFSNNDEQTTTPVIIGVYGDTGATGDKGATGSTGKGISSIVEYYAVSTSNSTAPSSWVTSMPTLTATNKYLWNYTRYTYTDNTYVDTTKIVIGTYGDKGDKGDKGSTGSTGVGVSSIAEKYAVSSSNSTEPTSWQDIVPTLTATNKYLWNYEIFTLTNGTTMNTKKRVIGVYGDKGATGATGNGISSVVNYYLASASGSGITNASSGFTTLIQTPTATLKYLWNYELITYTNGTTVKSPACVIGVYGDKGPKGDTGATGSPGATGRSIETVTEYYLATSASSGVTRSTNGWTTTIQTTTVSKKYLWNYSKISWSSAPVTSYVEPRIIGTHGETGPKGEDGEPARGITITPSQPIISLTDRGDLNTHEILLTITVSNLPIESVVWSATDEGSLLPIEIDDGVYAPNLRMLDCSMVQGDSTTITATIVHEDLTYTGSVGIPKVSEGPPVPIYIGASAEVPDLTEKGSLTPGDFFLYIGDYIGDSVDPGDAGLNAPASDEGEFIYGRIYVYRGNDVWVESRSSEHLAAAQKDALQIAKDSGRYLYVAVLVAQLGLFQDLLVGGILKSTNYSETGAGVPLAGFHLDGVAGLIKALGLEAYEAMIYGNLEASGFRTIQEEPGVTIPITTITPSLWKQSERDNLIASQDSRYSVSGVIDGYSFNLATRRNNERVLLASHGYTSKNIPAGGINGVTVHIFPLLVPSHIFGLTFRCKYSGYYKGNYSSRAYVRIDTTTGSGPIIENLGTSYTVDKTYTLPGNDYGFAIQHSSTAWWGNQPSHVNYHQVWTNQVFTGLVLTNGESSYKVIAPNPNAYFTNSTTWSIGQQTQANLLNYRSGTDFYNLFSSLSVGADGFCDGGAVEINGTSYTVTRLIKGTNSITLYTDKGVVTVNRFQPGTSVGVYTSLKVTSAINFQAVAGGIETKHIFPYGKQAGTAGNYDIGTSDTRFNTGYFNSMDIKGLAPVLTKNLNGYPGLVHSDGTDSNYFRTPLNGLIPHASGGSGYMGTSSWPFNEGHFNAVSTGNGLNKIYANSYQDISIVAKKRETATLTAMNVGEVKYVCLRIRNTNYVKELKLPSGGTYLIVLSSEPDTGSGFWAPFNQVIFSGGATIRLYNTKHESVENRALIIRRAT